MADRRPPCGHKRSTAPYSPDRARLHRLAGALAFGHRLESSPYDGEIDAASQCSKIEGTFVNASLELLELPSMSALSTCVDAGLLATPHLAKLASVLKLKYTEVFRSGSTLPVDLNLGPQYAYHSTFTCPISKEVATGANPPMLLPCGHVLALGSLTKLCGSRSARFKCPYCPAESTIAKTQALGI